MDAKCCVKLSTTVLWTVAAGEICAEIWKTAHPIGISYADASQYLPDVSVCWMLLGNSYRMGSFLQKLISAVTRCVSTEKYRLDVIFGL